MAHSEIADEFHALSLSDPKYLLFRPSNENAWLWEKFNAVPRYLFRVFTPNSHGETNRTWTKSMDARDGNQNSRVDIFARESKEEVAGMLYRHLRWFPGPEDNLVSWTSPILFALVYKFHLRANTRNGSAFDDISLCIIDTTEFPKEVFMRDMDLIQAYLQYSEDLQDFNGLRSRNDYYFGEYLSQGALKIKDRCQIVPARAIIMIKN